MSRVLHLARSSAHTLFTAVFRLLVGTRGAALIWRVPGASGFYQWLMPRLTPNQVEVDGHALELDRMDSLLLAVNGNYEADEQRLFSSCVQPGDTVVDIGAHIGLYAVQAARATGPSGRVVAFEPADANFALLERNLVRNGYDWVELEQAAVTDVDGTVSLQLSAVNSGDHSLSATVEPGRETREVRSVRLDSWEPELRPAVVKMDIQGAEPQAIAGAQRVLSGQDDLVLFSEVSPRHLGGRVGQDALLAALIDLGLTLFELTGTGCREIDRTDEARMAALASLDHWDVVGVKGAGSARLTAALSL